MMFRNMIMAMAAAFIASATPVPVPQGGCPDCVSPLVLVEFFSASGCPDPSTHPGVSAQNVTFGAGANNTCTPLSGLDLGFTVESAKFIANTEPGVTCSVIYDANCGDNLGTAGPLGACESRANGGFNGLFLRCSPPSS